MKKQFIYLFFIVVIISCNNNESTNSNTTVKEKVAEGKIKFKNESTKFSTIVEDTTFSIIIPEGLERLSAEIIRKKYPNGTKSEFVYGNEDVSVSLGMSFNFEKLETKDDFSKALIETENGLKSHDGIDFESLEVVVINGLKHGVIAFYSHSFDGRIFNLMSFVENGENMSLVVFNCLESQVLFWKPIFKEALNTFKIEISGKKHIYDN